MSLKQYRECGVCKEQEFDLLLYKKKWVRVHAPDSAMNFKNNSYSFWEDFGVDIDICSSYCLLEIQEKMYDEEIDIG